MNWCSVKSYESQGLTSRKGGKSCRVWSHMSYFKFHIPIQENANIHALGMNSIVIGLHLQADTPRVNYRNTTRYIYSCRVPHQRLVMFGIGVPSPALTPNLTRSQGKGYIFVTAKTQMEQQYSLIPNYKILAFISRNIERLQFHDRDGNMGYGTAAFENITSLSFTATRRPELRISPIRDELIAMTRDELYDPLMGFLIKWRFTEQNSKDYPSGTMLEIVIGLQLFLSTKDIDVKFFKH